MAPKRMFTPSKNALHSRVASSSPSTNYTPSHVRFCDEKACMDFLENFSRRDIHFKCQVVLLDFSDTDIPTVIYNRSWESLCGILVTCPSMIIQEFYSNMHRFDYLVHHFITCVRGTCIIVTSNLIFEVLHILRVAHPDDLGCDHLKIVSKDKLSSLFCETPSSWDNHQNTPCSGFAKGPRFLNIVMTFVLHPLSHYNSITEPRARFLLSLLEGLTIDFPFYFIVSLIEVYKDSATCDKLIFPSTIMRILRYASVSYPESTYFLVMCAIVAAIVQRSKA